MSGEGRAGAREGASVIIRKSGEDPLASFMSRTAFAALTCGFDLISDKGFCHSFAADAETPEALEASRSVTWLWDARRTATFKPIAAETIGFQEFERRFESDTWYLENPDHPIAYMRAFLEKSRKYLEVLRNSEPALRHRRGIAVAILPASATPEEVDEMFAGLDDEE